LDGRRPGKTDDGRTPGTEPAKSLRSRDMDGRRPGQAGEKKMMKNSRAKLPVTNRQKAEQPAIAKKTL
jgi:hypothetical protein